MKNAGIAPGSAAVTGNMAHPATRGAMLSRACTDRQVLTLDTAAGSPVTSVP